MIEPPVNVIRPTIAGLPRPGSTLMASPGTWGGWPTSYAYRWRRGGVDIPGATGSAYTCAEDDIGAMVNVEITASNAAGSAAAASKARGPVAYRER